MPGPDPQPPVHPLFTLPAAEPRWGLRERLIYSAFEEFAQHGFHGASLRRLCQRAQASIGNVGHLFDGKLGLLKAVEEAVALPLFQERLDSLEALLAREPNPTVGQVFDASVGPLQRYFQEPELGALRARYFLWSALEHEVFWPLVKREGETFWTRCLEAYQRALPCVPEAQLAFRMNAAHRFFGNGIIPLMQNRDDPQVATAEEVAQLRRWSIAMLVDPFAGREGELERSSPLD